MLDDWTPERHAEAKERVMAGIASGRRLPPGLRDLRDALTEIVRLQALPCPNQDCEERGAAADRLAREAFNFCHGEDCTFNSDSWDSQESCDECNANDGRPCSCDCGMCEVWRDALIIRPQGVRDPQPAARED